MIALEEAKNHLRVDHTGDDADIAIKLRLAAAIVNDYIGPSAFPDPDIVDAATFLVLGELYQNREAGGANVLSPTVRAILERLRVPGFA